MTEHQPSAADKDQTNMVRIVYILYLVSLVVGITSLVAVVLAHVYHGGANEPQRSHFQYQYRTFWIGLLYGIVCLLTSFIGVGFILMLGLLVWFIVRCAKGLMAINNGQAMPVPTTWLW
ncbi:hypothetical protein S7S_16890 [Isoalcanivorax pacificus W11-5]|uniref:Transmembrane protein n=1 Tax=Isoalcanivorax pacificus W11-5 TaxID=391936 RepID=A0A0B4XSS7_9GAMM|nr:membrane protein [Isoalcanivorax pacificus]AJD49790.1 hypothetical protein S7S_16890 [Isoalcanivorax pacificus W11-5]